MKSKQPTNGSKNARKHPEEALASVSRALIEGQEQERTRIARELHDDLAQRLTLLTIELRQLQEDLSDLPVKVHNRVRQIWKQAFEICADTQSLSHELHSSTLEYMGLVPAMRGFCKNFGDRQMAQISFTARRIPPTLPNEISLTLFRVMQEALHNALKHSGVRHFEVEAQGSLTEISLTVRDSGAGFDPKLARNSQGLGLISIKERINLVNGTLSITSKPGSGTKISVRVPLLAETGAALAKSA
jgi:signal transduction histidine kinase